MQNKIEEKYKEKNVLEILESKISSIKTKKGALLEELSNNEEEILKIRENIDILNKTLEKILRNNDEANTKISNFTKTLEELELGYASIVDSGKCLLNCLE